MPDRTQDDIFATTRWTMVLHAGRADTTRAAKALTELDPLQPQPNGDSGAGGLEREFLPVHRDARQAPPFRTVSRRSKNRFRNASIIFRKTSCMSIWRKIWQRRSSIPSRRSNNIPHPSTQRERNRTPRAAGDTRPLLSQSSHSPMLNRDRLVSGIGRRNMAIQSQRPFQWTPFNPSPMVTRAREGSKGNSYQ